MRQLKRIVGYLGLLLLAGCAALSGPVERPKVTLTSIQLMDAGLFEQRYLMRLRVRNPNRFELPVEGLQYELLLDGRSFAEGLSNAPFTVPAHGETQFEVEVSSNLLQTAGHLSSLLEGGREGLDYEMRGYIDVDLGLVRRIPYSQQGSIPLR